jgi:Ca2+-binding EF-hand superfamily protein
VPEASPKTREEKRFGRYDKDRNGAITRDEYLVSRRKAYAKLDGDGDGRLSFDEWATKTTTKFAGADRDKSGSMNAAEFATTAVKRKPARRAPCPPAQAEEG